MIADSSTVAMPSITVPSPGISSPAGTTTTSPRVELGGRPCVEPSRIVATVSLRIARSVSAWARPRPSANASAMFAKTTVSHSQNEIVNVYQAGSWPPPSGLPPNDLDQPGDGRDHRADLDDEHHRVADLHARVELLEAVEQRARDDVALEQRDRLALVGRRHLRGHQPLPPVRRSRARFSSSTFTPGSPEKPSPRPSVYLAISAVDRRSARGGARRRCGGPGSRRWPARFRGRGSRRRC